MTKAAIDAYVASKWPQAVKSPLASLVREVTDDVRSEAAAHAQECLDACDGWDIETLGLNIESNYPELNQDDCEKIAEAAIANAKGQA